LNKRNSCQKNIAFRLLLFFVLSVLLGPLVQASDKQGTVEFIYGRFTPSDAQFKKVYQKGGSIEGLILSGNLVSNFNLYLEVKAFSRSGELTFTKEKTKFFMLPLSLGVRYILPRGWFLPYAGFGTDFYFYYENNPIGTVTNYAHGYHLQGGTYIRPAESVPVWLNLKLKYTKAQAEYKGRTLELGGLEFGIGLALVF